MKLKFKYCFNLVELTLALGVAAVGIAAVMGVLPYAFRSTKSVVADSLVSEAVENLFCFLEEAKSGNNQNWKTYFENDTNIPKTAFSNNGPPRAEDLTKVKNESLTATWKSGYCRYVFGPKDVDVGDFGVDLQCRKSFVENLIAIDVIASWPITLPYENREKRYFRRIFFDELY